MRFLDGTTKRVHFFGSQLKYSRWAEVSLVANEQVGRSSALAVQRGWMAPGAYGGVL